MRSLAAYSSLPSILTSHPTNHRPLPSLQVDAVVAACSHPDVVRGLFSATLPEGVEALARSVLRDPLRVTVGERNTAAASVAQRLHFVGSDSGRLLALRTLLREGLRPPVLVFTSTKERAAALRRELAFDGAHVDALHAGQPLAARRAAVDAFRSGATWVLVATDLVARGMDFAGVRTVVSYDFPRSTTDYIHRVGRTGRAGRSGAAVTFFAEEDSGKLRGVANVMAAAGAEVPAWMLTLKKERKRKPKVADEAEAAAAAPAPAAEGGGGKTAAQGAAPKPSRLAAARPAALAPAGGAAEGPRSRRRRVRAEGQGV
jgi:ATP-dependent RNA helicase DDX52/ROK1